MKMSERFYNRVLSYCKHMNRGFDPHITKYDIDIVMDKFTDDEKVMFKYFFEDGCTIKTCSNMLNMCYTAACRSYRKLERMIEALVLKCRGLKYDTPLKVTFLYGITTRTYHALMRSGRTTIRDLAGLIIDKEIDEVYIRDIGSKSKEELKRIFSELENDGLITF